MEIIELLPKYVNYVCQIVMNRWDVDKEYAITQVESWLRRDDNSICYVGVVDGKPMATGVFDTVSDVDFSIPCWNTLLWVEPEYRGKGYGQMLTKKRFEYAKEKGFPTVYLDTVSAKDYHLKFGWEIVREFEKDGEYYTIMKQDLSNVEDRTFRPIQISDIPKCVEIYKLNNHLDSDEWISLLKNELESAFEPSKFITPKYFVCEQYDGKILGFAGYSNCGFDVEAFGLTWCNVHPDHKGFGIGKKLVEERLKSIIKDGGKKVFSSQREEVTWHLERFGFERLEENGEYDGDKYFLMRKKLE